MVFLWFSLKMVVNHYHYTRQPDHFYVPKKGVSCDAPHGIATGDVFHGLGRAAVQTPKVSDMGDGEIMGKSREDGSEIPSLHGNIWENDPKRWEKMGKSLKSMEVSFKNIILLGKSPLNKIMVDFPGFGADCWASNSASVWRWWRTLWDEEHAKWANKWRSQPTLPELDTFGGEAGEISVKCQMNPTKAGVLIL